MGRRWIVTVVNAGLSCVSRLSPWGQPWGPRWCNPWGDRLVLLGLLVVLLLGSPTPVMAAVGPPLPADDLAPLASPTQPDANDIPSETVSRFVKAYIAVVKLIEARELNLQRAETDTESRQMQQEIQSAALDLIQANGLTLSAYWELLGLANSDPEFRDRVLAQIDEASP